MQTRHNGHILDRKFEVTEEQEQKIIKWLEEEVYPPLVEKQLADPEWKSRCERFGGYRDGKLVVPYLGTISCGPTYCFTPNGVGETFTVQAFDKELDLTDYDTW